ncbi:Saposin B domain and Saposin-like domain-containing protein [Strongyloides ratti]|uniref:Saposin B domain and Saposin-like domain-containing protein n=1 Tax=Strongyloides ratti TaxID=34506 RepID=A0A090L1P7_STRRB|nr:Saposin B domain and Saposin-like domain-containing protein [Strongyloides ratti]CEF63696.1 Saposin B domain and Saposin-like domain-containing protein [Strongyloides ratti]
MKFALLSVLFFTTIFLTFGMPKDVSVDLDLKGMECPICEMIVKQSELWIGKEGEERESAVISLCEKELTSLGIYGKMICDAFVKDELDNIIKHMEDGTDEAKDARKVCTKAKLCKSS